LANPNAVDLKRGVEIIDLYNNYGEAASTLVVILMPVIQLLTMADILKCIIVDDELRARSGLKKLIENYCEHIVVADMADSVANARIAIAAHKPDLVFLDIDMPGGDGFDLLEQMDNISFEVIFATAYDQFALKAIKFSALDYLLKPIDLEELIAAVDKVHKKKGAFPDRERYQSLKANIAQKNLERIALPAADGLIFVNIKDIIRLQSDGSYTIFHTTTNKNIMVTKSLGEYEEILEENGFFRTHHSHIVNINRVQKYVRGRGGYVVMDDGSSVDVSARRKDEFMALLKV
jgi:two-component system LytT family response regulator